MLSDLGTVVAGGTPSKTKPEYYSEQGIAWITPKDLSLNKSKFISHGEIDISELGFYKSSATKMPTGTVLFSSRAPIGYIAIAANDGKYKFVEAYTEGDKVIALWNGKGIPASIRYAWENNPPSSIYNTEGLPASSFQLAIINK